MKPLQEYIKESILDRNNINKMDDDMRNYPILEFIKNNYNTKEFDITKLEISKEPNKDGKYIVNYNGSFLDKIKVKNSDIKSLTNEYFVWGKVNCDFICQNCDVLKSLIGAPYNVEGHFNCSSCECLTSLEYSPEIVGGDYVCFFSPNLKSLKYISKKIGGNVEGGFCDKLESLECEYVKIKGCFNCSFCNNLKSLKNAPKYVGLDFICTSCGGNFTEEDVKKVSNVKRNIITEM